MTSGKKHPHPAAHHRISATPVAPDPLTRSLWTLGLLAWAVFVVWQAMAFFPWPPVLSEFFSLRRYPSPIFHEWLQHGLITIKHFGLMGIWVLAAHGLGRWALDAWFPASQHTRLERALYAMGLGFNFWMLLIFLLGVFGGLRPGWFQGIWFLGSALGLWRTWQVRHELMPRRGWLLGSSPALSDWGLAAVLIGFMGLVYLNANAPELFFDALVYHLAVPSQWIIRGGIVPLPHSFFSNLPMNMEMLYTGALMLGDERLCRLLHATLSMAGGLVVFSLARRWFGRRAGWWAAGIYLTIPLLIMNMNESGIDGGAAFYALLACLALADWFFSPVPEAGARPAILAGWFTGAALGCKYVTGFILIPAYLAALITTNLRQHFTWPRFRLLLLAGAAVLALTLPWLVKSAVFTGNPVYPFLFKVIPSRGIDANKMQQQMDGFREFGTRTWQQYFRLPWDLTFFLPTSNSFLGVVFLFLAPGLLLLAWESRRGPPVLRFLLLSVAGAAMLWASITQIMRYFLPALGLLAVLMAVVLDRWEQHRQVGRLMRWLVLGLMVICGGTMVHMLTLYIDPVGVALGLETPTSYLQRKLMNNYTPAAQSINQLTGKVHILSVGETRSYYFKQPVTAATVYDPDPLIQILQHADSAEVAWRTLRAQGYTHVFFNYQEASRIRAYEPYQWNSKSLQCLSELQAFYFRCISDFDNQTLFAIADQKILDQPLKAGRPLFTYPTEIINKVNDHLARSYQANQTGNLAQVEAELQRCLQLAPEWDAPYKQLGWLYLSLNRGVDSLAMFRRAQMLGRLDPSALNNLGVLEMNAGQVQAARAAFRAALLAQPGLEEARKNLESTGHSPVKP